MTPEYIKSLKSLSDEEKSVMLKGLEKKKTLTFADNKGKWYIPCCEQEIMQINSESDWGFAIGFDPDWVVPTFYDTYKEALAATGEHTGGGGYTISNGEAKKVQL